MRQALFSIAFYPMIANTAQQFARHFLGDSPVWYKQLIVFFLVLNPVLLMVAGNQICAWALLFEFIVTLMMALRCYPLQAGGLIALQGVLMGLTTTEHIYHELIINFEVILLLIFMVAGIYFLRDLLLLIFTHLLLSIKSRYIMGVLFLALSAFFSAFLDALTVTAILITVFSGFYTVYSKAVKDLNEPDAIRFRQVLRGLTMHGLIGTALGGVCTMVGEPQNLLIAERMGWEFGEFFVHMSPVTMPVLCVGIVMCILLQHFKLFGYGATLPDSVRTILLEYENNVRQASKTAGTNVKLSVQLLGLILLIAALAFHVAPIGLIGLALIVLMTAANGITKEHDLLHAFQEAMPFTALLVVFFAVVAIINDQNLFDPVLNLLLQIDARWRPTFFYAANGILSAVSDNVFVATAYMEQLQQLVRDGSISEEESVLLAIAINTGTNIPSIATPNGQAAFLFMLTSGLAQMIRLSYFRMLWLALPYTLTIGFVGMFAVYAFL